ncbi:MAG: MBL fold metallo-hydrolase [Clostridia bacterium]|nr:MBL fold metallo-hydrolase [Clostridia bacterium]
MKVTFLGTGAADWDINAYAPGQPHRRFSSALINEELLIDPGPHIFHFCEHNGTPDLLDGIKNIIVTHSHGDHFTPETVARLCVGKDCTLWADAACMRKLIRVLGEETAAKIRFVETKLNRDYEIGGYKVTPLRSNHATEDPDEDTRLYLVEQNRRILYYGCDSAWIPTTAWNIIKTRPVNAMVLELTCGETARNDWRIFEHNTIEMLELMLITFRKYNYFAPDVKFYVSHMARTLHTDHETLVKTLEPLGVTPAYDGFSFKV